MATPTKNPVPSSAKNDQLFNAEKIDQVVNSDDLQYSDRFGKKRYTFTGLYNIIQNWMSSLNDTTGAGNVKTRSGLSVQAELTGLGSVDEIRALEPVYKNQKVRVWKLSDSGTVINQDIYFDDSDTTTADDGYSVFVTPLGARWKVDVSRGISVEWGGLLADGSNLGTCINKIVTGELAKLISKNGVYTDIVTQINISSASKPRMIRQYILDQPVYLPSFFCIKAFSYTVIRYLNTTTPAFTINNQYPGLTSDMGSYINMQGSKIFSCDSGMIRLVGPGATTSQSSGICFGNLAAGSAILDVRDTMISDIHVRGFKIGFEPHAFDTYICSFERMHLVGNYWNIGTTAIDKSNSGEKIIFRDCTIANSVSHNIYWNMVGWNMTFDNCSIDYAGGCALYLDNGGRANYFRFTNGTFIEGFATYLIQQAAMSTTWTQDKNFIIFDNSFVNAATTAQVGWHPRRQIIKAPYDNNCIIFNNTPIKWPSAPSEPYLAIYGITDDTVKYNKGIYRCPVSPYEQPLLNYAASLNNGVTKFSGTAGVAVTKDAATNFTFSKTSGVTAVYGAADSDGLIPVILTFASTTDTVEISNNDLFFQIPHYGEINGGMSIMMSNITSGTLALLMKLYLYGNRTYTSTYNATGPTVTTKGDFALLSSYSSESYDVTSLLSVPDTPLTTSKYVGVQVTKQHTYSDPSNAIVVRPSLILSGIVGTISIKLPVYWMTEGLNTPLALTR